MNEKDHHWRIMVGVKYGAKGLDWNIGPQVSIMAPLA